MCARAFSPYGVECDLCMFFTRYAREGDIMGHCSFYGIKVKKFEDAPECELWTGVVNHDLDD